MPKIRAAIIDDEPFARERVRRLLAADGGEDGIEIVGEAGDGVEAVRLIREKLPALIFLDVQMPGKDGFEVLAELAPEETPAVIFLTAYDRYAVKAFEAAALDYLLKPFDEERFERAVARAKSQLLRRGSDGQNEDAATGEVFKAGGSAVDSLDRVMVKRGGRVYFFKTDEIEWVEAYGNYVRLHFERATYLMRETISGLESQLAAKKFARVHRSGLVNLRRVREIKPLFGRRSKIVLGSGAEILVSRRYNRKLLKLFEKS